MLPAVASCWWNPFKWRDCGKIFNIKVDLGTRGTLKSDCNIRVIAAENTETDVSPQTTSV